MAAVLDKYEMIDLIKRYYDVLRESMLIDAIYLFGSYSRGKADQDSDIDLLVVSPDFTDNVIEDRMKLMRARREVDYRIEPHPVMRGKLDSSVLFTIAKREMLRVI
ncbi:MAG: nucleotidyltransferase domain-containing protein [Candidatus Cloacimonetes bacterium]|jgi:predicted nucleotidyltransferase|nr:nucleotidyltransferase domain-containing protein [Candidatus Cloacimonadota bacterium]HPH60538.1 nucleotidyltransferase domain-containing protein [Candidatus Syntrophosphaera sp.]